MEREKPASSSAWAGMWLLASSVMPPLGMLVLLSQVAAVSPWLRGHGIAGGVLAAAAFSVLGGMAMVPTFSFSIVCGWAFGAGWGAAVAMAAVLGATLIGHAVGKWCAAGVLALLERRPRLGAVVHALVRASPGRTIVLITLLRVPVIAPFAIVNAMLAMVHTRLRLVLAATAIGMLPRTLAGAWFGATLSRIDIAELTSQPREMWLLALSIAAVVAALAGVAWVTKRTLTEMLAADTAALDQPAGMSTLRS